jgi:hypothetical protein
LRSVDQLPRQLVAAQLRPTNYLVAQFECLLLDATKLFEKAVICAQIAIF